MINSLGLISILSIYSINIFYQYILSIQPSVHFLRQSNIAHFMNMRQVHFAQIYLEGDGVFFKTDLVTGGFA